MAADARVTLRLHGRSTGIFTAPGSCAARIAREAGLDVGWYPQESNQPISFRSGGQAGGQVQ